MRTRPVSMPDKIQRLLRLGKTQVEIAAALGISDRTVRRAIARHGLSASSPPVEGQPNSQSAMAPEDAHRQAKAGQKGRGGPNAKEVGPQLAAEVAKYSRQVAKAHLAGKTPAQIISDGIPLDVVENVLDRLYRLEAAHDESLKKKVEEIEEALAEVQGILYPDGPDGSDLKGNVNELQKMIAGIKERLRLAQYSCAKCKKSNVLQFVLKCKDCGENNITWCPY